MIRVSRACLFHLHNPSIHTMKTLFAAFLAIITLLSASGQLAVATPGQKKAFLEAVKKAYEAGDEKTLKSFMYTVGADPQLVDLFTEMLTTGMGTPVTSIELVPMTPEEIKDAGTPDPLPNGKMGKFSAVPTMTLVIKVITKDGTSPTRSWSRRRTASLSSPCRGPSNSGFSDHVSPWGGRIASENTIPLSCNRHEPQYISDMSLKILYTAHAVSTGGRNGHSQNADGLVSVDLSVPKAMGGPGKPNTTTPEDLFATGYAACFGSAVDFMAHQLKLVPKSVEIKSAVSIGQNENGGFGLAVEMEALVGGLSQADAEKIVQAGHSICPYSNAIKGNVEVKIKVVTV
jgi:lipoyl-dependent peroxiredoxin